MDDTAPALPDRAAWIEDAFGALDVAAILFDADGRCIHSNARYNRTFYPDDAPPRPGEEMLDLKRRMALGGRVAMFPGRSPEDAARDSEAAIRGFLSDIEVPMADGRVLIGTSSPTSMGGYLVTFRDTSRDRMGERRAMTLLADAFETADMGMILWDAGLRIQMANGAWSTLMGPTTAGASIRDHAHDLHHAGVGRVPPDEDVTEHIDGFIARAHREPTQAETRLSGGRRAQVATFPTQSGGVLATAIDITAARAAEARARDLLEDAVEALGEGVALYDHDLCSMMNNGAFRALLFGETAAPVPGTSLADEVAAAIACGSLAPADGAPPGAVVAEITDAVRHCRSGVELMLDGGRILEVSGFATALGGYLMSVADVTERRQAERATREADELVRTIVEASPTTFLVSRVSDGKIIYAPPASRERFGEITSTLSFFLHPEDRTTYLEALLPTGSLVEYPVQFRRADGSVMEGLTSARVAEYKGEEIIVSSTRDITEQLAMQAELERQREIAHQTEKMSALGELLAGVAHELNNPLSVVLGYAMMLEDKIADPVLARRAGEIRVAADRCARIVKTFLAMARQRPAELKPLDINEVVGLALEVSDYGLRSLGAEIVLALAPDLPAASGDGDQIAQVFTNLIVNAEHALRSAGGDGRLAISSHADRDTGELVVRFADNGAGIDPAVRSRIFEPFFTTKDVGIGTGVGLAFCHRIVVAHGGRISVRSAPGEGAVFSVRLPSIGSHATDQTGTCAAPCTRTGRVLVIDDDPSVAGLVSEILDDAGYDVTTLTSGPEALTLCHATPFDAIVSDVRMPGMDGPALWSALSREVPAAAKRLAFLTGDTLSPNVVRALEASGRPSLEKPVAPADLLDLVAELMMEGRT